MCFFRGFTWTGHFIEAFSVGGGGIKWPVQHRFCFFRGFTWTGHFIEAFSVGGGGIKWPVQHRFCFFRGFTWTGHFIEAFSVWGGGIKWPVQHRFCFFRGFTWTGHFIEKKISLERGPQGEWGPGRAARARQKGLKIEAILARARGAPRTPFTPRTPFKGKCVRGILCWGRGYKVASPT